MKKQLTIVIVSFNNLPVLCNCLDSVIEHNDLGDGLQIIVVEQSPTNDIYHYIKKNYPTVDLIRAENKGFGAGNNRGVEIAKAPYLLLLNPDTILLEPIGKFALDKFSDNSLGIFGVQLLDKEMKKSTSFENNIPFGILAKVKYKICNLFNVFMEKQMYIQGADIFIRTDLFRKVGGFNEKVFMYFEEADICSLVRKEKYKIRFYKEKRIVHLQGACSPEKYSIVFNRQLDAFCKYCDRHSIKYRRYFCKEFKYQNIKKALLCLLLKTNTEEYNICIQKLNILNKYLK